MKGTVRRYFEKYGYGFITGADGTDYFVHQSEICMKGFRKLLPGQKVSFDPAKGDKGWTAVGVIPEPQQ